MAGGRELEDEKEERRWEGLGGSEGGREGATAGLRKPVEAGLWRDLALKRAGAARRTKTTCHPHQSSLSGVVKVNPQCNVVGRFGVPV